MRRFVILLTTLAIIWCGWWAIGAFAVERGLSSWLEDRRAEGWQAEVASTDVSGFPLSWHAALGATVLTDPESGVKTSLDGLSVSVPTYAPFSGRLDLPETPITFETALEKYFVKMLAGEAYLAMRPSLSPQIKSASVTSGAWQFNARQGNVLSGEMLSATAVERPNAKGTYDIAVDAAMLTPGDVIRQALGLSTDWPRAFDRFNANLAVQVDQNAQRATPSQPVAILRQFDISEIDLAWGPLSLDGLGAVAIDDAGVPEGSLTLVIKNWREPYNIAKQSGLVKAEFHLQADLMLNAIANIGGDPETLDLTIRFQDGAMFLGPIPLGPAPRILF